MWSGSGYILRTEPRALAGKGNVEPKTTHVWAVRSLSSLEDHQSWQLWLHVAGAPHLPPGALGSFIRLGLPTESAQCSWDKPCLLFGLPRQPLTLSNPPASAPNMPWLYQPPPPSGIPFSHPHSACLVLPPVTALSNVKAWLSSPPPLLRHLQLPSVGLQG